MRSGRGLVVIGGSLGSFDVIRDLLGGLPGNFPACLVLVLHRMADEHSRLDTLLDDRSKLPVSEPNHGQPIVPGRAYLAPADYHVMVEADTLALTTDARVLHARPSIDVLFESAAHSHGARAVGVVLTGASEDGARGAAALAARGAPIVVQDPATALAPLAPRAVVERVPTAEVLPHEAIAPRLVELVEAS